MGWIGDMSRVLDALKANNADKDEEGRFLIRNGGVVTFLGMGQEAVIKDETECCMGGEWKPLCPLLSGGLHVVVI